MNLQLDNNIQKNSALDKLVSANAEAMKQIGMTPYQPILYAIPKDQRDAEFRLLQEAWNFQPELYRQLRTLATTEALEECCTQMENTAVSRLTEANQMTVSEMRSLISQDGKMLERFISDSSMALDTRIKDLDSIRSRWQKDIIRIQIWTAVSAVTLSTLVSVVLWRLLD